MMKIRFYGLGAALLPLLLTGCHTGKSTGDIPAVHPFALERYVGVWYEAARLPHRFERGMIQVSATYTPDPDGSVKVLNRGLRQGKEHTVSGVARQKQPGTGELEVSFFRPFYAPYRVIFYDEAAGAAIVTSATRDYAWILVRDFRKAAKLLPALVKKLEAWGFDTALLEYP